MQRLFSEENAQHCEDFYKLPALELTNDLPTEMNLLNPYNKSNVATTDNVVMAPFYG
jgi:hypothetical protein